MKKFITYILLFCLGFSFSGSRIEIHYCLGRISSISLDSSFNCPCKHLKKDSCCHSKTIQWTIKNPSPSFFISYNFPTPLISIHHEGSNGFFQSNISWKEYIGPLKEGHPPQYSPPQYLLFRSFRV